MSGTQATGFVGAVFPQPIQLGKTPPDSEGPKTVAVAINWQAVVNATKAFTQQINLLSQFQSGQFSTPQAVYIDNQTCPEMVTFVCADTGQQIRVPPFAKGMYPLLCSQAPEFAVTLNISFNPNNGQAFSACSTRLFFFNTEQVYFESAPANFGQNLNFYSYTSFVSGGGSGIFPLDNNGGVGPGLIALGGNQHYAITSLDYTLTVVIPYGGVTVTGFTVRESSFPTPGIALYQSSFLVPAAFTGVLEKRQILFPVPVITIDPNSFLQWQLTPPAGVNSILAEFNITYAVVTIQ